MKDGNITKSVIVGLGATLLCLILVSLSWDLFVKTVSYAIDKTSVVDYRVRMLAVILNPERASFVISGLLTGVFIGLVSKNNRVLTTTVTLLLMTTVFVLSWLGSFYWFGKEFMLIRIYLSCVRFASAGGCILLGVWFVSRLSRKRGRQSLTGDNLTAPPQQ